MSTPSFEQFATTARERGFEEVAERRWEAGVQLATHTHPFAVEALVVHGEMWLECAGQTRHLHPGDRFELSHGQPHAERYGPEGATYWAARRHATG
jgi:quercetin dioxygenase-like cupin family protein